MIFFRCSEKNPLCPKLSPIPSSLSNFSLFFRSLPFHTPHTSALSLVFTSKLRALNPNFVFLSNQAQGSTVLSIFRVLFSLPESPISSLSPTLSSRTPPPTECIY